MYINRGQYRVKHLLFDLRRTKHADKRIIMEPDDHQLFREGVKRILDFQKRIL